MNKYLREMILKQRLSISLDEYEKMSNTISSKLFLDIHFIQAKIIAIYLPINQEVDTRLILDYAKEHGKTIVVPKIKGDQIIMVLYQPPFIHSKFGVSIPKKEDIIEREQIDLIICPIVGFKNNMRMGYGKGYYDRYLKSYHGFTIGLAFSFQEIDFETHTHDWPLDLIITEKG